eukprot:scaffold64168_cov78-Attheya_sp.AAC.5
MTLMWVKSMLRRGQYHTCRTLLSVRILEDGKLVVEIRIVVWVTLRSDCLAGCRDIAHREKTGGWNGVHGLNDCRS